MGSQIILKGVGFWEPSPELASFYPPGLPHPRDLIDHSWEQDDRAQIVSYLRAGFRLHQCLGYSWCRLEGGPPPEKMGNADRTDGVWLWPEGLHVYIEQFHVRLPDEFVAQMRQRRFTIPESIQSKGVGDHSVDMSFWLEWARAQVLNSPRRDRAQSPT